MLKLVPVILAAAAAALASHFALKTWMDEVNPAITGGIAGAVAAAVCQRNYAKRDA